MSRAVWESREQPVTVDENIQGQDGEPRVIRDPKLKLKTTALRRMTSTKRPESLPMALTRVSAAP